MAFPFCPMTDEMLKKLSQVIEDSDRNADFLNLSAELASQDFKSESEINLPHLETNQSNLLTSNR